MQAVQERMERVKQIAFVPKSKRQEQATLEVHLSMSYEQWLTEIDENAHTEWVDGEAILFMPPTEDHQDVVTFIASLLNPFVRYFQLGKVIVAPFEMKVAPESNAREPDLLFVANQNIHRLTGKKLAGAADLVIEVISPESVYRDRSDKFDEYESAGVKEYWVIDARPNKNNAQFWLLDEAGHYKPVAIGSDGIYRSTMVPGFWLKPEWFWRTKKMNPLPMLIEIIGRDKMIEIIQTETL